MHWFVDSLLISPGRFRSALAVLLVGLGPTVLFTVWLTMRSVFWALDTFWSRLLGPLVRAFFVKL